MKEFTLFLLCLVPIILVNAQLRPSVRTLHGAVHVEKKLYIFGGFKVPAPTNSTTEAPYNLNPDDRFFYLDLSIPFDTSNLPWRAIPNNNESLPLDFLSPVFAGGVAIGAGGEKNDTLYFINSEKTPTLSRVLSFNTQDNTWHTPDVSGEPPIGRNQMRAITDRNGKMHLLTGFTFNTFQGLTTTKGMFVFDTNTFNCLLKIDNVPISRLEYTATLLPNGTIIYLAGREANRVNIQDNFRVVYLYNTLDGTWSGQFTSGPAPGSDNGMSSVLGLDGNRIIIFGGASINNANLLYELDLTTSTWRVPTTGGQIVPRYRRNDHTANVVGKYMLIAFGAGRALDFSYRTTGESDVLLLDISNVSEYVWVTTFDPNAVVPQPSPSLPPSESSPKQNNAGVIAGSVVGSIVAAGAILGVAYFFIKRNRKDADELKKAIPTPSEYSEYSESNVISIPSDQELSHGTHGRYTVK